MGDAYTTGSWRPYAGQEDAFVEAWREFAEWAATMPGSGTARLTRDLRDPERFVSLLRWTSIEAVRAWKGAPEFKERMSRVQRYVDKFQPSELEVVAEVTVGAAAARAGGGGD